MPTYGYRRRYPNKTRGTYNSRTANFRRVRRYPTAAKATPKTRRAAYRRVAKNSAAITAIAKKVNRGNIQFNYHQARLVSAFELTPTTPMLWALNDFYRSDQDGGDIYYPTYSGTAPNIIPDVATAGQWDVYNPGVVAGLAPEFRQYEDNLNDDTVSRRNFTPLYASHTINFGQAMRNSAEPPTWIRIDILSPKRNYLTNSVQKKQLPGCLGAFQNLAVQDMPNERNSINPYLWHVKTRWIKIPQVNVDTPDYSRTVKVYHKFPNKMIKIDMPVTTGGVHETSFWAQMQPKDIPWIMISVGPTIIDSSFPQSPTTRWNVTMTRKVTWRDPSGNTM